jgi:hypothetical protein
VQPFVSTAELESPVEVTTTFLDGSKNAEGVLGATGDHDAIVTATKDIYTHAQRLLASGHGTGRLAVVEGSTVASNSFTATVLGGGTFQLHLNDPIDFVNLDTGGTVQASAIITDIDPITRRVTTDTSLTLTAGWGVYHTGDYGKTLPNGCRNIVDDGDYATSIFGISRAAPNTYLNGIVLDNNQGIQDYSEVLISNGLAQARLRGGVVPTILRCNEGIIQEHQRVTTPDRVYVVMNGENPKYPTGINHERLAFQYGDTKIPFEVDTYLPPRELYGLHMPSWNRITLKKLDWEKANGQIMWHQKPAAGGETYAHALIANMTMKMNIFCRKLNANVKWSYIRDRGSARDS